MCVCMCVQLTDSYPHNKLPKKQKQFKWKWGKYIYCEPVFSCNNKNETLQFATENWIAINTKPLKYFWCRSGCDFSLLYTIAEVHAYCLGSFLQLFRQPFAVVHCKRYKNKKINYQFGIIISTRRNGEKEKLIQC